jgi:hypothetical protein
MCIDGSNLTGPSKMGHFEIVVRRGHEAERLTTAFYRYLELKKPPSEDAAFCETEVLGEFERRKIELWSTDAAEDFGRYLATFTVPPPAGLPRRWGPRGFDVL